MSYDTKGNASHYKTNRLDTMIVFERTFGTLATMTFCEINALKYRLRLGHKEQPLEQELVKANWYETQAKTLFKKLGTKKEIIVNNRKKHTSNI